MIPIGGKIGHYDLSKLKYDINSLTTLQKYALFNLLKITIKLREANINKYTIKHIYCLNMKPCINEIESYKKRGIQSATFIDRTIFLFLEIKPSTLCFCMGSFTNFTLFECV